MPKLPAMHLHPPTRAIQRPYRVSAEMVKRTPGNRTYDTTDDGVGPMVQNIAAISFMLAIAPRLNLTQAMAMTLYIVRRW